MIEIWMNFENTNLIWLEYGDFNSIIQSQMTFAKNRIELN